MNNFSILFDFFMKNVDFCTVFIAYTNSTCKKTLTCVFFIEFADKAQFLPNLSKAIALQFSRFSEKFEKF